MKKRKVISMILAAGTIMSCMAFPAMADETEVTGAVEETEASEETEVTEETPVSEETEASEETVVSEETEVTGETEVTEETLLTEETITSEETEIEDVEDSDCEAAGIQITADVFPDPVFRQYIEDKVDFDGNKILSESEIDNMEYLWLDEYAELKDLTGISIFGNADFIKVDNTCVSEIDVSGLMNLKTLAVSNTNSDSLSIDLSGCSALESIYINNAPIEELDISDCPNLKTLDIRSTEISSIDLTGMKNLKNLAVSGTNITCINIMDCPYLKKAYLEPTDENWNAYADPDYYQFKYQNAYSLEVPYDWYSPSSSWERFTVLYELVAPSNIKVSDIRIDSLKLSWDPVTGADGYQVWRSDSENGKYTCIMSSSDTSKVSSSLEAATNYYYKIRSYRVVDGKKEYGPYSEVLKLFTAPDLASVTRVSANDTRIRLNFIGNENYIDYNVSVTTSPYTDSGTAVVISGSKTACNYTLKSSGTLYYVKIRGYYEYNGNTYYTEWCPPIPVMIPADMTTLTASNIKRNQVTLTWEPVDGINMIYEVWRSRDKNSGFVCLGRYTGLSKVSTCLSPNTTYYYKVRAYYYYYDNEGVIHRFYGGYTPTISVTTLK